MLYSAFRQQAWWNIEIVFSHYADDTRLLQNIDGMPFCRWEKDIATTLLRFFELADEYPDLADQVKQLPPLLDIVLAEIARCLPLFSKFDQFQLHDILRGRVPHWMLVLDYKKAFHENSYFAPIKRLVITTEQFTIAEGCPFLRDLYLLGPPTSSLEYLPDEPWLGIPNMPTRFLETLDTVRGMADLEVIGWTMLTLKFIQVYEMITNTDAYMALVPKLGGLQPCGELEHFKLLLLGADGVSKDDCQRIADAANVRLLRIPRFRDGEAKYEVVILDS
ncbi:hypothetical protein AX16_009380 [Volvariella volvacea WC 439]|nr:hypothetical protein AX16_009380 [Volvariella volvacea WC 439]